MDIDILNFIGEATVYDKKEKIERNKPKFCTRWTGLIMTSGLGEAIDDIELEGSVIGQLQDAVTFIRNNSHKRWWKENDHRKNYRIIRSVP